jgi:hypothetical protein
MPPRKIQTTIHFFNARQSRFNKDWSPYCEKPIKSYEVIGDHFSIFKVPGVAEFSQTFDRLLGNIK